MKNLFKKLSTESVNKFKVEASVNQYYCDLIMCGNCHEDALKKVKEVLGIMITEVSNIEGKTI